MRKVVFALLAVAAFVSIANADTLVLFYDARADAAAIATPAAPYTNNASLSTQAYYGIGQNYPPTPLYSLPIPLPNGGAQGDGQMVWVSPKIGDVVDYYGNVATDGIPDEQSYITPGLDYSLASFYLYAEFTGDAGAVVSSIGVDQTIDAAAFAGPSLYLQSATTTLVNTGLWSTNGTAVGGTPAVTTLKMVQVPVKAGTSGPEFDTAAGIIAGSGIQQIAKVDIAGALRPVGLDPAVGIYNVRLTENALKVTNCKATAPSALTKNYGYDWDTGDPDIAGKPDMVIYVVPKGDFDLDGTGSSSIDNGAYGDITLYATTDNFNPFEQWLGDFDGDGAPCTSIDNADYFRCASIPLP